MITVFLVVLAFMSGIVLHAITDNNFPEDLLHVIAGLTIIGFGFLALAGALYLMQIFS